MFGRTFDLFTLLGFRIRVDLSWFLVALLVAGSFASLFADAYPELTPGGVWSLGVAVALGLFASVVLHELAHAVVARRFGIEMRGITLFIFGGVAEMRDEPPSPRAEFLVAIAGPVASLAISAAFLLGRVAAQVLDAAPSLAVVPGLLSLLNVSLALFNMVPAFPLDGGRVLRAALWQWHGNLRRATRLTSGIGSGFGFLLLGLGIFSMISGDLLGGIWFFLIGLFVRHAAQMSYQQVLLRRVLEGEPVSRFMQSDPVTVPRAASVEELVEGFVYRYHHKMFPVVDGERLVGCVTTRQLRDLPREVWSTTSVGALAADCSGENSVAPDTDAMQALAAMSRSGQSRLLVTQGDRLLGILSLKDLLDFFALKIELEER